MDTINHYVGMYPIAAGGPVERGFGQFLMIMLGIMLIGFMCTKPKVRVGILGVGFAGLIGWMYLTMYSEGGFNLQNEGYVEALITSLDQEATGDKAAEPTESVNPIVARLRKSLEDSGVVVESTAPKTSEKAETSVKQNLIEQLKATYDKDFQKGRVKEAWDGSSFQVMAWHYGKSLGRYFNNQEEIVPMVANLKIALNVVFVGLIIAMVLLVYGARKNGGIFYWLLVLVPLGLPLFFIIDYSAWLWWYGHTLNDMGAFSVKPFMPTVFGQGKVAQFTTHSYPYIGFGIMMISSLVLAVAALVRWKQFKSSSAA
jgi:hypothetical protein